MSGHPLPLLEGPRPERSDAARNREALLAAARRMVAENGVESVNHRPHELVVVPV